MSEYQYYDFYSIDRSLNREEIETVRGYSSRVNPSSRRATFVYHYSDFRYDEEEVLNNFFDIMLYVANWGSRRLLLKFPQKLVSYKALKEYEIDASYEYSQEIKVFLKGTNVIIDMYHSIEYGGWLEGEGMLDELLPLRAQILNGDYRVLYLGWLHLALGNPEMADDLREPSLPANLTDLDYSLESFVNFWEIDVDLISAASEKSEQVLGISDEVLQSQIIQLSENEKDQYLKELVVNEVAAKSSLRKHLENLVKGPKPVKNQQSRTLREIKIAMSEQEEVREEQDRIEAEKARLQKMARIEAEELTMWQEVRENADLKTAKGYDHATKVLLELKEYYDFKQSRISFDNKIGNLLLKYGRSVAFKRRLKANEII